MMYRVSYQRSQDEGIMDFETQRFPKSRSKSQVEKEIGEDGHVIWLTPIDGWRIQHQKVASFEWLSGCHLLSQDSFLSKDIYSHSTTMPR